MRKLAQPIAWLLIAAQLLLAAPALAMSKVAGSAEASLPCDGMTMHEPGDDAEHCPCCPDGVDSMQDCLASCLLAVAAIPAELVAHVLPPNGQLFIEPIYSPGARSGPPLNPPPIA